MAEYHEKLANDLVEIRRAIHRIESALGELQLESDEGNQYEKSVIVMKVGAKLMKTELELHGQRKIGRRAKEAEGVVYG